MKLMHSLDGIVKEKKKKTCKRTHTQIRLELGKLVVDDGDRKWVAGVTRWGRRR